MKKTLVIAILITIFITFAAAVKAQKKVEMRASWIATVSNIDWPSGGNYDTERQQQEMINILDSLALLNINTIYFQVRPTADAFYYSDFEPWSKYLTGEQNKEPNPFYDPLSFVIKEAHARFIDVHVWLNPYRVLTSTDTTELYREHLFYRRRDMFVEYGGKYYFNPGLEETREYLCDVVTDIVSRYNIEGVHFDDYFYPYKIEGEIFPDYETFMDDPKGFDNIEDWRRNNVNLVIQELNKEIKSTKPYVEFGISPFGVWRNKEDDPSGSDSRAGQTNYDDLYADIKLWLEEGWIDYVVPQLYWEIGKEVADYTKLAKWWNDHSYGKNLYIGLGAHKLGGNAAPAWKKPNELCRQLEENRRFGNISGVVYFANKALMRNSQGIADSLIMNHYKYPAIPPTVFPAAKAPMQPMNMRVEMMGNRPYLFWDDVKKKAGEEVSYYIIYMFPELSDMDINNPKYIYAKSRDVCLDLSELRKEKKSAVFVVTSVNRYHKESPGKEYLQYYF